MSEISFENTAIAFAYKDDRALQRAYFLFRLLASPALVGISNGLFRISHRLHLPLGWIVKPTVYRHFVGGETLEECNPTVHLLADYDVKSILDYSIEGTESEAEIEAALEETLRSIRHAASEANIPFAVFKPTAFTTSHILEKASSGEPLTEEEIAEADQFRQRIRRLCQTGYELGVRILIDAEDSWYQAFIDQVVTEMMEEFNKERAIVFNTLQMYRRDRLDYLRKAHTESSRKGYFYGVKFVRGAYMEKERRRAWKMGYADPIQPDKASTDRDYDAALKYAIDHIDNVEVFNGTHNEKSSLYLASLIREKKLAANDDRLWFSQLYGMSDHISFNLAHHGFNVAKYVPYGPVRSVLPYLLRRAEENTSIAGQTSRELKLLRKERARRKNEKH